MPLEELVKELTQIPPTEGKKRYFFLLDCLHKKRITVEELEKLCYLWTLELEDEFKPQPIPSKFEAVEKYEELKAKANSPIKQEMVEDYYIRHPEVSAYYETVRKIEQENKVKKEWLEKAKQEVENAN